MEYTEEKCCPVKQILTVILKTPRQRCGIVMQTVFHMK